MLALLALYPIWGLFQQVLAQGIFVRTVAGLGIGCWTKIAATVPLVASAAATLSLAATTPTTLPRPATSGPPELPGELLTDSQRVALADIRTRFGVALPACAEKCP